MHLTRTLFALLVLPSLVPALSPSAFAQGASVGARFTVIDEATRKSRSFFDAGLAQAPFTGPHQLAPVPLHLVGRAAADALDPALPQETQELGVAAVRLSDRGWLLKFRNRVTKEFGLLHVDALGGAQVLLTLPEVAGRDPFTDGVAVSATEERAAVATDENRTGRGDAWLLDLDGGTFAATGTPARCVTASIPGADVDMASLTLAHGALFFIDNDSTLMRAPTDGSADATALSIPLSGGTKPVEIGEEIALCRDGSTLAFHAGASEKVWDLYVARADGSVWNLTQAPGEYESVGHLPDEPLGPFVSLSPDGTRITYAFEIPDQELFTRASDGSDAAVQLTTDQEFEESIDDGSTIITFASTIFFSMGESAGNHDFYRAIVGAGTPAVGNLTVTSGDPLAPFDKGAQLTPFLAARVGGLVGTLVVDDRSTGAGPAFDLWTVGESAAALRTADLLLPPQIVTGGPPTNPVTLAVVTRTAAVELLSIPADPALPATVLLSFPSGVDVEGLTIRADGRDAAFVARGLQSVAVVAAITLPGARLRIFTPLPGFAASQVAYSPAGRVLFAWGLTPDLAAFAEQPIGSGRVRRLQGISGALRFLAR